MCIISTVLTVTTEALCCHVIYVNWAGALAVSIQTLRLQHIKNSNALLAGKYKMAKKLIQYYLTVFFYIREMLLFIVI